MKPSLEWLRTWVVENQVSLILGAVASALLLLLRVLQLRRERIKTDLTLRESAANAERYCPNLSAEEIAAYTSDYVEPDCSQVDPTHEGEFGRFASVRAPVFEAVDEFFNDKTSKHHLLVLADTGVGKTSFCVNYYHGCIAKKTHANIALVSLAAPNALKSISKMPSKSTTIILLDALDEDKEAIKRGGERLFEILRACAEYRGVLVTCRSHFFESDELIPLRTGIARVSPRAFQPATYDLFRLYLLPFNKKQVDDYLGRHFRFWQLRSIKEAKSLIETIPDLSARPMLLSLVPDLIRRQRKSYEIFELYEYMVDKWFDREKDWIPKDRLEKISEELAIFLATQKLKSGKDKASPANIRNLIGSRGIDIDWKLLTTRSLLNRDSDGNLKFSHRSIMEYLCVKLAIAGDPRPKALYWSAFMRELLYSFGSISNENARKILYNVEYLQKHRAETGFPHAEPLREPDLVSAEDLREISLTHRIERGASRDIPIGLRHLSIRLESRADSFQLYDDEYGLEWHLADTNSEVVRADPDIYRSTLENSSKKREANDFRLPSFAEFVSLVEAQRGWTDDRIFVSPDHFYWIGDWMYGGVRLLATLNNTLAEGTGKLVLSSMLSGGQTVRLKVYAIDPAKRRSTGVIRGFEPLVRKLN